MNWEILDSSAFEKQQPQETKNRNCFEVMSQCCNECLFGSNKIVSEERKTGILNDCQETGRYFVCHKATLADRDVCCRGFYDRNPYHNTAMRLAAILNVVRFVTFEDTHDA